MGRTVYLTDKEINALRSASSEWCEIMSSGDEKSVQIVENTLKDGLGSALKKLYKGCNGERAYIEY